MLCIASFLVLSFLGLFSATHRRLAREAFSCVVRRVTLRPCDTGFDSKIKAKILSGLIARSPKVAKFVQARFELLSWILVIALLASSALAARGLVNYYLYGSCNGLNKSGFCAFDPTGSHNAVSAAETECRVNPPSEKDLTLKNVDLSIFPTLTSDSGRTLLFIGCYNCDYTRAAYPLIQKLLKEVPATYIFAHFPTKENTAYLSAYATCLYQQSPGALWAFNDWLFNSKKEEVADPEYANGVIARLGLDVNQVLSCVNSEATAKTVAEQQDQLKKIGVYGTPTIFMNGKPVVGPKPYRVYKRLLRTFP